jgi:hypothetical protein
MGFRKLDIDGHTWEWMFLGSWNPKTFGDLIRVKSPKGENTRVTYAQFFGHDLHDDRRGNTGITPGVVASYIRKVLVGGGTWDPEKDMKASFRYTDEAGGHTLMVSKTRAFRERNYKFRTGREGW